MLRKCFALFAILVFAQSGWSKTAKRPSAELGKLTKFMIMLQCATARANWELNYYDGNDPTAKMLTATEMAKVVGSSSFPKRGAGKRDCALLKKYQTQLKSLVSGFSYAKGRVYYLDGLNIYSGDGKTCLHLSAIADQKVYNRLRLNAYQRAAEVYSAYIPSLAFELAVSLKSQKDIPLYAVTIVYGAKDFSDDSAVATEGEAIFIVASSRDWVLLKEGTITDQQFATRADVFLLEAGVSTERRVDLKL